MRQMVNLLRIDPAADPLWAALTRQQHGGLFHSPLWIEVLRRTYGLDVAAHILTDDQGIPRAGMLFSEVSDVRGPRIVSLPFSDYCDPLVSNPRDWQELRDPLLATGKPVAMRCLHNDIPLSDAEFEHPKLAKWHGIDLVEDVSTHWSRIDSSARRAVRKAEKSGLTTRIASSEDDLRSFFNLHLGVRKYKYRLLAQPYRFFRNIWDIFSEAGLAALMLAEANDEVVGSVMYLGWGSTLYYKFSASSPSHLDSRPTDLLIWDGIKFAKEHGYRYLDLGLSDWDQDGLVRYKSKFATEEKTIHFLRHSGRRPATPQEEEFPALLNTLTGLLTEPNVPDVVTERAGDALYRFFV